MLHLGQSHDRAPGTTLYPGHDRHCRACRRRCYGIARRANSCPGTRCRRIWTVSATRSASPSNRWRGRPGPGSSAPASSAATAAATAGWRSRRGTDGPTTAVSAGFRALPVRSGPAPSSGSHPGSTRNSARRSTCSTSAARQAPPSRVAPEGRISRDAARFQEPACSSPHFSPGSWSARRCPADRAGEARGAMRHIGQAPRRTLSAGQRRPKGRAQAPARGVAGLNRRHGYALRPAPGGTNACARRRP